MAEMQKKSEKSKKHQLSKEEYEQKLKKLKALLELQKKIEEREKRLKATKQSSSPKPNISNTSQTVKIKKTTPKKETLKQDLLLHDERLENALDADELSFNDSLLLEKSKPLPTSLKPQETLDEDLDLLLESEDDMNLLRDISSSQNVADVQGMDAIDFEIERLQASLKKDRKALQEDVYKRLKELHDWIDKPQYGFMYHVPSKKKQKKDFDSWREDWSHVLLDYAKLSCSHIIYPKKLLTVPPFNNFYDRSLAIEVICNTLVEKKLAKWLDRKKEQLRVYWRSMEEWPTLIENWAMDEGFFDLLTLDDIRESGEEFANLPEEDLEKIFKMLEKEKKGKLYKERKKLIGFKFNSF